MDLTLLVICLLAVIPLLLAIGKARRPKSNLPPQPRGLPIIGNLHHLGKLPHRGLQRLSATHGPLLYIKLGSVPTLVASSPEMAMEVLKTHDLVFCSRAEIGATKMFSYGFLDIAFSPYCENWKNMRAIFMQELLSSKKIRSFRLFREEEVAVLVNSIIKLQRASSPVDVGAMALCLFNNITYRETFGKRESDEDACFRSRFHDLITESMALISGLCLEDFFPSMWWVGVLTGAKSALTEAFRRLDQFLEEEILKAGRELEEEEEEPCFIKTLLRLHRSSSNTSLGFALSKDHVKALLMNVFFAASDTSAVAVEWAMAEMMRNPAVMTKAQAEVRGVAGQKRRVEETDVEHLPYLKRVVKETLRLHPPGVIPFPRESREDCKVSGYDVPAKTRVLVNSWAINRDPEYWEEPERFWPERFEEKDVDYRKHNFQLLPFGGGRRMCPGITLALHAVELTLANMLRCFDWELPDGIPLEEMDMDEKFGLSTHKKVPLLLKAISVV